MSAVAMEGLRGIRVTRGDGLPHGAFRMQVNVWTAYAIATAFGLAAPAWFLTDLVRLNHRFGLPWTEGLAEELLLAGTFSAACLVGTWVVLLRPRLEVSPSGLRVVRGFDTLRLSWADVESFDCTVRLTIHCRQPYVDWPGRDLARTDVEVEALTAGTPLRLLGMTRAGAGAHGLDVLTARLNAHLATEQGRPETELPVAMDTPEGRQRIRTMTITLTAIGLVGSALSLWLF